MNYHAGINRMDRFMKRALLIISTTLSCLGLTGCSWMSQDPCSGKDADLSNPACVVQSKQTIETMTQGGIVLVTLRRRTGLVPAV